MSDLNYHRVTLLVPQTQDEYLDGQSDPGRWDWTALADTVGPIIVESSDYVGTLEEQA